MFVTSDVGKGEYLFEYETARVYHPSKKAKHVGVMRGMGKAHTCLKLSMAKSWCSMPPGHFTL